MKKCKNYKDKITVLEQDKKDFLIEKENFENKFQLDPNGVYQKLQKEFKELDKEYQMFKKDQELEKSNLKKTIDLAKQQAIIDFKNLEDGEYKQLEQRTFWFDETIKFFQQFFF